MRRCDGRPGTDGDRWGERNYNGLARMLGGGEERRLDMEETREKVLVNGRMVRVGQVGRHCMDNKQYRLL